MNLMLGIVEGGREIWAHKFRSFLTMLGIILGVASLLSMFALTAGMASGFRETLQQVGGVEHIDIIDAPVPANQEDIAELSPGRTYQDALALRKSASLVKNVSPVVRIEGAKLSYRNDSLNVNVAGVEREFLETEKHAVHDGRFFSDLDQLNRNHVVVLGRSTVDKLWNDTQIVPLGETIRINGENFKVIGVFKRYVDQETERAQAAGITKQQDQRRKQRGVTKQKNRWEPFYWKNNIAVIPLTTMVDVFKSARVDSTTGTDLGPDLKLTKLSVELRTSGNFDSAIQQMRNILLLTHRGIRDFGFDTREDMFDEIERSVRAARISGGLIAGISLLVGGLGITNIMLASITERIREIGIRRAIGARAGDIFVQILIEGIVLALLGGVLGLVVAYGLVKLLVVIAPVDNVPIIESSAVLISFSFALIVGIVAGIYPAWKASQLSPIQALRYE